MKRGRKSKELGKRRGNEQTLLPMPLKMLGHWTSAEPDPGASASGQELRGVQRLGPPKLTNAVVT